MATTDASTIAAELPPAAAAVVATPASASAPAPASAAVAKNIAEVQIHITPEMSTTVSKCRYVVGDLRKVLPKQLVTATGLRTKETNIMSRMIGPIAFPSKNLCNAYRVTLNGKPSTTMNLHDTATMRWWSTMCGDRLVKGVGPYLSLAGLKKTDVIEMHTQMCNTQDLHLESDGKLHGVIALECLLPVNGMPTRVTMLKSNMAQAGADVSAQLDLQRLRVMCGEVEFMRKYIAPALDGATASSFTFQPSAAAATTPSAPHIRDRVTMFLPVVMQVPTYAEVGDFLGQPVVTYVRECSRSDKASKGDQNKIVDTTVPVSTSTYADNMLISCTCITSGTESGRSALHQNIQKHVMPTKDDLVLMLPDYRINQDMLGALRRLQAANIVSRKFETPLLEAMEGNMLCLDWMSKSMVPPLGIMKQLLKRTSGAFEANPMQARIHANITATLEMIARNTKHLVLKPRLELMMIPVEGVCLGMKDATSLEQRELFQVSHLEQSEALLLEVSRGRLPEKTFLTLFKEWVMTTPEMILVAACLPDFAAFGELEDMPFVGKQKLVPVTNIERKPASEGKAPKSSVQAVWDLLDALSNRPLSSDVNMTAKLAHLARVVFGMDCVRAPISVLLEHSVGNGKLAVGVGVNTPFVLAAVDGPTCISQLGVPLHAASKLQWDMTDVRAQAAHNLAQVMRGGCIDVQFVGPHPIFRNTTWTKTVPGGMTWTLGHRHAVHVRVDPCKIEGLTSIRMYWMPPGTDNVSLNMPLVKSDAAGILTSTLTSTHPMSHLLYRLPSMSPRACLQLEDFVCIHGAGAAETELAASERSRLFQWITSWQDVDVKAEAARQDKAAASEAGHARGTAVGTLARKATRTPSPDVSLDRTLAAGAGFVGDTAQTAVAAAMSSSFKPPHAPKKGGAANKGKAVASPSALGTQTVHSMAHAAHVASKTPSPQLMGLAGVGNLDSIKPLCLPGMSVATTTTETATAADATS